MDANRHQCGSGLSAAIADLSDLTIQRCNDSRGERRLTRREWLRLSLSAGTLLSLGLWPGRLRGADAPATGDFTFIAVNDLHALEPACRPWFDEVVRQMKASAPAAKFCLLGGD